MPTQDGYAPWPPPYLRRRCVRPRAVRPRQRGSTTPRAAQRLPPRTQPPSGLGAPPFRVGLPSRLPCVARGHETEALTSIPSTVAKPTSSHRVEDAADERDGPWRHGDQRRRRQNSVLAEQFDVRGC